MIGWPPTGATWIALGLILAIAEVVAPGAYLLWIGLAALLTGVVLLLAPALGLPVQLLLFAIATAVLILVASRVLSVYRTRDRGAARLNDRAASLVGKSVVVVEAVHPGGGRVRLGDGEWLARGNDAAVGERLVVIGIEGITLIVG